MSQLVQFKQRIAAVETIKKITHAMRLIAMSAHARLKQREGHLNRFTSELQQLGAMLASNKAADTHNAKAPRTLLIIVGSQKGLCGTFNSNLLRKLEIILPTLGPIDVLTIGKQVKSYCHRHHLKPKHAFTGLGFATITKVSAELTDYLIAHWSDYHSIKILSNHSRSFFVQRPELYELSASSKQDEFAQSAVDLGQYVWEEDAQALAHYLWQTQLRMSIEYYLFNSFLAEQAARFQSMDAATRNAETLLETMKRQYNKLRQAKITKELIELSSATTQQ